MTGENVGVTKLVRKRSGFFSTGFMEVENAVKFIFIKVSVLVR